MNNFPHISTESEGLFRNNILPNITYISPAYFNEGVNYNTHMHKETELLFLMEGKSMQYINNKKYLAQKGDMIILNPESLHAEMSLPGSPVKLITCKLDNVKIRNLADGTLIAESITPIIDCHEYYNEIVNLFREAYYDMTFNKVYSKELANLNIAKILYYLYRILEKNPKEEAPSLSEMTKTIQEYLDKHYQEDISLDDLSKKFFISSSYIAHEMKRELGISPINYLINRRIGEAQRLLIYSEITTTQIAEKVGYKNPNYFNKLFQKKTGHTPAKFRELYQAKDRIHQNI